MRALESRRRPAARPAKRLISGKPRRDGDLQEAVETRVEAVVRAAADRAAERTAASLARAPRRAGAARGGDGSRRASAELEPPTEEEVRAWQGVVFDLVREEGAAKRATARLASLGVNGAGLTVMLAVFAHTGGLTGAEVVVAGGTSALSQKRARGDLRRPGGAHAGRAGPGGPLCAGRAPPA